MTPANPPSLFPPNLRNILSQPLTPWRVNLDLFNRLRQSPDGDKDYKTCILLTSDPEFEFITKYFHQSKPDRYSIRRISCIHNSIQSVSFESDLQNIENESNLEIYNPTWQQETLPTERARVIQRWKSFTEQFSPLEIPGNHGERVTPIDRAKVLPLWHGSKKEKCETICKSGFTYFGKHHYLDSSIPAGKAPSTDVGYFGSGIYFTDSAKYATMYSQGYLILAWVSMREPYPVVSNVANPKKVDDITDVRNLKGRSHYQNYNAHFIPVRAKMLGSIEYFPCNGNQSPECDEFVVFHKVQTLPRFWIELCIDTPRSLEPSAEDEYQMGLSLSKDPKTEERSYRAFQAFKTSAEKGHLNAQRELAACYFKGHGVTRNPEEACLWYERVCLVSQNQITLLQRELEKTRFPFKEQEQPQSPPPILKETPPVQLSLYPPVPSTEPAPPTSTPPPVPKIEKLNISLEELIPENTSDLICVNTIEDEFPAYSLAFLKEEVLASSNQVNMIKIWDIKNGKTLRTFETKAFSLLALRENILVSGGHNIIQIWNTDNGECLRSLEHPHYVYGLAAFGEERLASGSHDNTIKLWNTTTGVCLRTLKDHSERVSALTVSDRVLVSGSFDKSIKLWDTTTGVCTRTFENAHADYSTDWTFALTPLEGKVFASKGAKYIKLWDQTAGKCVRTFSSEDYLQSLVTHDKNSLIYGDSDGQLVLLDIATGKKLIAFTDCGAINCLATHGKENIAAATNKKIIKLLKYKPQQQLSNNDQEQLIAWYTISNSTISQMYKNDEPRKVTSRSTIEKVSKMQCVKTLENSGGVLAYLGNGILASGSYDSTIRLWDITQDRNMRSLKVGGALKSMATVSQEAVACGLLDNTIKVLNITNTDQSLYTLVGHYYPVEKLTMLEKEVLASTSSGIIKVWDISTTKCLRTFTSSLGAGLGLSHLGGKILISAGRHIKLWDMRSGKYFHTIEGHSDYITAITTIGGRFLGSSSRDKTLKLWDIRMSKNLFTKELENEVKALTELEQGEALASGDVNGIKFWNTSTGECFQTLKNGYIHDLVVIDRNILASASFQNTTLWKYD